MFNSPDRSTLVELTLFANKGRSIGFEDPNVVVGRLLADHRGDHAREATEFNMQHVVDSLARRTAYLKGYLAGRLDGNGDQPWLRGWSDK